MPKAKPISLFPMSFEEAIKKLIFVDLEQKKHKKKRKKVKSLLKSSRR